MHDHVKALSVLAVSTLAFTMCFMVWLMFGVTAIPVRKVLGLSATEFGLLTAMPVLAGALVRLPLGMWTDRYGGRNVMTVVMATTLPALWSMNHATAYWHHLVIGLCIGLAGGVFSVGTPYVARWFPPWRQGFAMGIYGAGNAGAALNQLLAPALVVVFGWAAVPQAYAALMLAALVIFRLASHDAPAHRLPPGTPWRTQWRLLREPKVIKYCQYYGIVFGGYVALSLWMVQYYVGEYGLDLRTAALLAACFTLPGGLLRALGGWLADRHGAHAVTWWVLWVSWLCLFLLSYPQTEMLVSTARGPWHLQIGLGVQAFTLLLVLLGIAWAFGMASVFKYISDDYPEHIGTVSGIVGTVGGLSGFLLPILFGLLMDFTGVRSSAFMLLFGLVWMALIWMYLTEVRQVRMMGPRAPASPFGRPRG